MAQAVRADTVGSLLRPPALLEARRRRREGAGNAAEVRRLEDEAILDAIRLQERIGLDLVTDGEMRRTSWISTARGPLDGFELKPGGPGWEWHGTDSAGTYTAVAFPFVTRPVSVRSDLAEDEYRFLHHHARAPTKYCVPAPSYHRTVWHREHSREAYPRVDDFLVVMRDYVRDLLRKVAAMGCDCVQLDAPNYGNLCDQHLRAAVEAQGRDLDSELRFDVELDNSALAGLEGVTTALHVCRGNAAGNWAGSGGYDTIAPELFSRIAADRLLLEYDTPRAGGFEALRHVRDGVIVVLGLISTKSGALEDESAALARLREASRYVPLERLAISPQCGFASVEAGNPLTSPEQEAKLRLVRAVADRAWG